MRRPVIRGISTIAITIAAGYASLVIAAGVLNPLASRQSNGNVDISWSPETNSRVTNFTVIQCPYLSSPSTKCRPIADLTVMDPLVASIQSVDVFTTTSPVIKVRSEDRSVDPPYQIRSEWIPMPSTTPPPEGESPTSTTFVLQVGCQLNITTGQFPSELHQTVVDAGGHVQVNKAETVYVTVLEKVGVYEDDSRLLDLRDFEQECTTNLPLISR